MSEENVRILEGLMAAYDRGDWDAALSYAAPDCTFDTSRNSNEWRGVYEGHEDVKRMLEGFYEQWESWRTEIDEYVHVGENVVVTRQTGYLRGRDGIEVTARTSSVWTFRDGAVSAFVHYDEDDALEAARVSKQDGPAEA
jgi:ketosteroid isomerase-like protein